MEEKGKKSYEEEEEEQRQEQGLTVVKVWQCCWRWLTSLLGGGGRGVKEERRNRSYEEDDGTRFDCVQVDVVFYGCGQVGVAVLLAVAYFIVKRRKRRSKDKFKV